MTIELKETSRTYFKFGNNDKRRINFEGIKSTKDGLILFPRSVPGGPEQKNTIAFDDANSCIEWYDSMFKEFVPNEKITKECKNIKVDTSEIAPGEWELIQGIMARPKKFQPEDVQIYRPWAANNFVDRDRQRFPKTFLQKLGKTAYRKSLLSGHAWGDPGSGKIFDYKLKKTTISEAMEQIQGQPHKDIEGHLKKIEQIDGGIYWLALSYFTLTEDPDNRKRDAGIRGDVSLGFRANKLNEYKENNIVIWREYEDTGSSETVELSEVFLGSQLGTRNKEPNWKSDLNAVIEGIEDVTNEIEIETIKSPLKDIIEKLDQKITHKKIWLDSYTCHLKDNCFAYVGKDTDGNSCRQFPYKDQDGMTDLPHLRKALADIATQKDFNLSESTLKDIEKTLINQLKKSGFQLSNPGGKMKLFIKSLAIQRDDFESTDANVLQLSIDINEKMAVQQKEHQKNTDFIDGLKKAVGESFDITKFLTDYADLKIKALAGDKYRDQLIVDIINRKTVMGLIKTDKDPDAAKKDEDFLKTLSVDQLEIQLSQFVGTSKAASSATEENIENPDDKIEKKTINMNVTTA